MNIDLVLKRLELIKEGKGISTISDTEASIILNEIERLREENLLLRASEPMSKLQEDYGYKAEVDRLNNIIKIMEKYFELIIDLGYDYDGFNKEDSLKKLIDELCKYASLGRVCNTTETIYVNGDKKYNILHEELKGDGSNDSKRDV